MKSTQLRSIALTFAAATAVASVLYVLPLFADVPTAIPSIFFYVKDSGGANNGPGQKDLTLMGWYEDKGPLADASDDVLDLIWNWDEITVSGNNTLDACALFDSELPQGDGFINAAICGTVQKVNGPSGGMFLKSTTVYTCSNAKQDRCTNPALQAAPSATDLLAGGLAVNAQGVVQPIPANPYDLVTSTDPFNPLGDGSPKDTTIRIRIKRTWLNGLTPSGLPRLTNVCSYPSQEPNSDPSDCNNPPGGGFLKIVKDAIPDSTLDFGFRVVSTPSGAGENNCPSATPCSVNVKEGTPAQFSLLIGLTDVTENSVVPSWSLTGASCVEDGTTTSAGGSFDGTSKYSGASIKSGVITTCTFTNTRDTGTIKVRKVLDPSNDGGKFVLTITSGATTVGSLTNAGHNALLEKTVDTGTGYTLTETADTGTTLTNYNSAWTCTDGSSGSGTTISGLTVTKGATIDCTFTNTLKQGTLIVRKIVDNTANPSATPKIAKDFSFKDNGGSTVAFPAEPGDGDQDSSGLTSTVVLTVAPNSTHSIVENAVTGYSSTYAAVPGSNSCTNLTVAGGATVTCTITNTFDKASPGRTSQQNWVIHDKLSLTGLQVNAGTAKVNFRLYSNATCTVLVGSNLDRPITATATGFESVTGTGVAVANPGTYYWQVEYTGNAFYNPFTTSCNDAADRETTQILADDSVN